MDQNKQYIIVNGVPMSKRDYRRSQRAAKKNQEVADLIAGGAPESKTRGTQGQFPPARETRKMMVDGRKGLHREVIRDENYEIVGYVKHPTGPPKHMMTEEQKEEFLNYVKLGYSSKSICQLMGLTYKKILPNTIGSDPEFAHRIKLFQDARAEFCEAVMYRATNVLDEDEKLHDPEAALKYINMVRQREHTRIQLTVQKREIKLKQQMINRRMGLPIIDDDINVNNLDRAEFAELSNLIDAVRSGEENDGSMVQDGDPLSPAEMQRFGMLMLKCLGGSPKMIGG